MPRAVAQRDEGDLAARARGHHPRAHHDRLPDALRQGFDPLSFRHRGGIVVAALCTVNAIACTAYSPAAAKLTPERQETPWTVYLGTPQHDASAAETLSADPRPRWRAAATRAVRGCPALGERIIAV